MYFLALRIAKKYREITSIYRGSRKFDKIVNFGALFQGFLLITLPNVNLDG